jgi:hypothetical protein
VMPFGITADLYADGGESIDRALARQRGAA